MNKVFQSLLILLSLTLLACACAPLPHIQDEHGMSPHPDIIDPSPKIIQTPAPTNPVDPDINQKPPVEKPRDDIIVYEEGIYQVGTDIPEGLYVAVSDGSNDSRVTIKESQSAFTDKPKILITARYIASTESFSNRSTYVNAVSRGGGEPVQATGDPEFAAMLRLGSIEYADSLAERYDGLVLTGGGDVAGYFFNQDHHPAASPPDIVLDIAELELCRAFIRANKPVLGICRGMQVINIAMGGELIQDIPALLNIPLQVHKSDTARHDITVRRGTWLHSMVGVEVETNSFHHQCVDPVAPGFTVVAYTGPVIEAIERGNVLGVQFHPEQMLSENMLQFFEDFIYRCSNSNIVIDVFSSHTIVEIKDGQYIDIKGASLYSINHSKELFKDMPDEKGYYTEGMYLTGTHIPAGEYLLSVIDDGTFASYLIYSGLSYESLISRGNIPEESVTISLKDGEIIKLIYASMTLVD